MNHRKKEEKLSYTDNNVKTIYALIKYIKLFYYFLYCLKCQAE